MQPKLQLYLSMDDSMSKPRLHYQHPHLVCIDAQCLGDCMESVDSICKNRVDSQYMTIQKSQNPCNRLPVSQKAYCESAEPVCSHLQVYTPRPTYLSM